ncbi:hypothetical protein ACFFRR_005753 [Megaselia abdita]
MYRSVNFSALCRLCITGGGNMESGIHIFSPEGKKKKIFEKIKECLPTVVDENDELPKIICNQCVDQIESILQYRNSCLNAQIMLENCITSGTIKSSGKVYIKETTEKKTTQANKAVVETQFQNQQQRTASQTSCPANVRENNSPLEEFLKMKPNLKLSTFKKKDDVQFIIQKEIRNKSQVVDQPMYNEIKDKKINILLAPALNDQLYSQVENNQQNTSFKQYITKISPNNQLCNNSLNASLGNKQCMVPITIKNDGSPDKQIIAHINTKNVMLPTYQLQMKFQPNTNTVDRQTVVQLTPTSVPVSIQPVLGNTQQINQYQMTNSNAMPFYLTECKQTNVKMQASSVGGYENNDKNFAQNSTVIASENILNNQTASQMVTITTSPSSNNHQKTLAGIPSNIANVFLNKPGITINRVVNAQNQTSIVSSTAVESTSTVLSSQTCNEDSELKEIEKQGISLNTPTQTITATISEFKCKVCQKIFKKKEHMTQHMKLHAGLRPFKCNENYCNKAFSRKEHLMRHMVSHTGKKLFHCDICQKYFSRKDNLNKHRR